MAVLTSAGRGFFMECLLFIVFGTNTFISGVTGGAVILALSP
jgi:hypothetical protein